MALPQLSLVALTGEFAICRVGSDAPIPGWATAGRFFSITRTPDELSIVCDQARVPDGLQCERDWRCLRVADSMPFSVVGVLASLCVPLAAAGIGIFAVSTFDTDYLFVKTVDFEKAVDALRAAGHHIDCNQPSSSRIGAPS
jgi:hypothetical protein